MRNKSTLFYSVSQVKVLNEIYWQKGPVTFKLCKSLENSTGHGPGGHQYCRTLATIHESPWYFCNVVSVQSYQCYRQNPANPITSVAEVRQIATRVASGQWATREGNSFVWRARSLYDCWKQILSSVTAWYRERLILCNGSCKSKAIYLWSFSFICEQLE